MSQTWIFFLALLGVMILAGVVQANFKKKFKTYGATPNSSGKSGAQIAQEILSKNGITDVKVVQGTKPLGDNFNPTNKTITLSPEVYGSASVAAEAVAAHEVGHAIQWHTSYVGIKVRDFFLPLAQAGGAIAGTAMNIGFIIMFMSLLFGFYSNIFLWIILVSAIGMGAVALFQLATLPVEFNASKRASVALTEGGYGGVDNQDSSGVKTMLNAAAMTYVVAAISTIVQVLYMVSILLANSNR